MDFFSKFFKVSTILRILGHGLDVAGLAFFSDLMAQVAANPVSNDPTTAAIVAMFVAIVGKMIVSYFQAELNKPVDPVL